jgi:hypothetical protein
MKYLKNSLVFFCLIVSSYSIGQNRYKDSYMFKINVGMNIIDDSFTKKHVLIDAEEKWHSTFIPSYFGINMLLTEKTSVEGNISYNKYKKNKLVDGEFLKEEKIYFAIDVNAKYDFSDLTWHSDYLYFLSPYVFGGPGLTTIEDEPRLTMNYGFGTYIWFKDFAFTRQNNEILSHFGVFIQTQGKSSFKQKIYGNQIQHSFGLAYKFN